MCIIKAYVDERLSLLADDDDDDNNNNNNFEGRN